MKKKNELQLHSEKNLPAEFAKMKDNASMNQLIAVMPEHAQMLEVIKKNLPEVQRATSLFGKTQSQFMDNMMTVSANTPLRNLRQILAQMTSTRQAIKEANFKLKKAEIEAKIKRRDMEREEDELKKALLEIDVEEAEANAESTKIYLSGAIRQLANYTANYNNIKTAHNIGEFTEEDFEKEEERYHIMKAFEQAYCAAISHGGVVDEGNMIYFTQIGVNGASAQRELTEYLQLEFSLMQDKDAPKEPTHRMFLMFLDRMANKYAGCAATYAGIKGMDVRTDSALIQQGDTRLTDPNIPEKVLTRVKKLWALTKSPNENEASRALDKFEKYLLKSNLTLEQVKKHLL